MKTDHIIIVRFSAMGDVAMTVPIVFALATQYPKLRISVLSRPFARAFFQNMPDNVEFMEADLNNEYKGIHGLNKLFRRITAKHPTHIADFHNVLRTKYLRLRFCVNGYKTKHIDKHKLGKRRLCRKNNKIFVQQPTSFKNYMDVLEALGYPIRPDFQSIFVNGGNDIEQLPEGMNEKKEGEKWIGIAPFAAHKGKTYPKEKMEEVIRLLSTQRDHIKLFLFGGGREEKEILKSWEEKYEHCICASSALHGLSEELILMSHLEAMISMDSANMHLASLVGTRVISIWGATHPFCGFFGWNQDKEDAVQNNKLSCRPCSVFGNQPCHRKDFACMNSIEPSEIVSRLKLSKS
ncbi:glycosyltransferase family 9 protein [Prevotella brunnea]|uniref:glycosyltransferase family 9 protein n=1 Tax=Prevotella brunnea TaxID=2508867 RepID=UPI00282A2715|nr:glycosyltransferase family 9 protein [Prevotella brunnea]MDR0186669.1 glycosyltransferase family 9 protein [Prevotella brunnea]